MHAGAQPLGGSKEWQNFCSAPSVASQHSSATGSHGHGSLAQAAATTGGGGGGGAAHGQSISSLWHVRPQSRARAAASRSLHSSKHASFAVGRDEVSPCVARLPK